MEVVLASASSRRHLLLEQIGLRHRVLVSRIDEIGQGDSPQEMVERLALAKARDVAGRVGGADLVIGADTTVVLGDRVLGKPADDGEALEMLLTLSGKWHQVVTGVALVGGCHDVTLTAVESTWVKMQDFNQASARAYVATGEPSDKAGAYGIQGRGALLVEEIRGCYSNVVGLPLSRLGQMLEEAGLSVWKGADDT